ncbi:MFS transporter [Streptomyces sp. NPDC058572]|uniref:MFS transporter n=1 Tax=Streptomyces sp. NPDC058572 TaxID=3346546 RepID=UPI0036671C77
MIRALFTDPRERATALGIWAAMAALGGALGPILGGLLLAHFSWHAAFLVNVPVMAVAIIAGLLLLPESRNPRPGRWDLLAALLSMVGMVAFVHSIKHFAKEGLTGFVRRCIDRQDPLLEVRLFRSRPFTAGAIVAVTTAMAMAAMMLLIAQWMQLVEGFSPLQAGLRLLPAALGAGVVSPLAPQLAARWGPARCWPAAWRSPAGGGPADRARPDDLPVGGAVPAADRSGHGITGDRLRSHHGRRPGREVRKCRRDRGDRL